MIPRIAIFDHDRNRSFNDLINQWGDQKQLEEKSLEITCIFSPFFNFFDFQQIIPFSKVLLRNGHLFQPSEGA